MNPYDAVAVVEQDHVNLVNPVKTPADELEEGGSLWNEEW